MHNTPLCPVCNINLLADDFFDFNSDENTNIESWYGFCPNCHKDYTWKKIFIFSHFDEIKEE